MARLNQAQLQHLPKEVKLPQYDRNSLQAGIVHLGIGAFHRAHQAFYTEAVLNTLGGSWGIIGCSLRSANVRDQLSPQDGLYTLVERSGEGEKFQIIGAVIKNLVGPENPAELISIMSQPNIKIISMTVTEKGYCHDPATGNLNDSHEDIVHDLKNLYSPKSAIGYLVAALQQRYRAGTKSFTVLSCDNLPNNGDVLASVVMQFAEKIDVNLAEWIRTNTCFPSTMIDRIVPATTEFDKLELEEKIGLRDEGMVVAEPFTQWVIEDKFSDARPEWETVGALLVDDVRVFEKIKLRLLNGAHSIMAYAGYLSGFNYISEVMAEPAFVNMVKTYMAREAGATITTPKGFDIEFYKQQLRDRFSNKALKHRTWQIAMDGSQKLPQRLLDSLRWQLARNGNVEIICLGVAAWIRYVSGVDEKGNLIEVSDPLAVELRALCDANIDNPAAMVKAIVGVKKIFGDDLQHNDIFISITINWLEKFYAQGVLASIKQAFSA